MMMTEDTSLAQRPFRGLIPTSCAILAVLIVTVICWCIWAFIAHRRLQAQIDAITTLHQPFWEADFTSPRIPDEKNAAMLWKAAFAAAAPKDESPANSNLSFNGYPPFPLQWHQLEDRSIVNNQKFFELADRASRVNLANWGDNARSGWAHSSNLNSARQTANILADAALHEHFRGNDPLAVTRLVQILQLSRAVGQVGNVVSRLVSIGIAALGTERLLCIAPDLFVESGGTHTLAGGQTAVRRKDVESLIQLLLNESGERQQRLIAIDYERTISHQILQAEKSRRWVLGPMIDLSEIKLFKERKVDRLAAVAPDEAAMELVYKSDRTPGLGLASVSIQHTRPPQNSNLQRANVYDDLGYTMIRVLGTEWRGEAERKTAAIALAIRLYRADHQTWPENLAELVPSYLKDIPTDPFSPTHAPIGYVIRTNGERGGNDRPMLYFNMFTDPDTTLMPTEPVFGQSFEWSTQIGHWRFDQWRDLSRWYPVVSSSAPADESTP